MNKILLCYTAIGPTYKSRIVNNIFTYDGYKYFDVLILTDDPTYPEFDKFKECSNIFIEDLKPHRDAYPEFYNYEVLPNEKISEEIYNDETIELTQSRHYFPLHLQRFALNYKNINEYPYIIMSDIDMIPFFNDNSFGEMLNYFDNEMPNNSVSSNRCYQEWQHKMGVDAFLEKWAIRKGKNINYNTPVDCFDNPIKALKFESTDKTKQFFQLWNECLLDAYSDPRIDVIPCSWGAASETLLAILYKLEGIKVNTDSKSYGSLYGFKSHTYPEDRYWSFNVNNAGVIISPDKNIKTKDDYVKNHYDKLKKFYEGYGQEFKY